MMDRRAFVTIVGGTILVAPTVEAQQAGQHEAALAFFDTGSKSIVPVLVIPATEIMSVMVEPNRDSYRATIRIDPNATQRLYLFTERNIGKRVEIRFDRERLSTLSIVAPVSSGLVTLDVGQSEARINKVFAPLGSKFMWKRAGG